MHEHDPAAPPAVAAEREIRRVLCAQLLAAAAAAGGFAYTHGAAAALAAFYGGAVTLLGSGWMARTIRRSAAVAVRDGHRGARLLYRGVAQKFAFTVAALVLGIVALGLEPLPVVIGFAVAHLGYLTTAVGRD